jgi:hypothetical protein
MHNNAISAIYLTAVVTHLMYTSDVQQKNEIFLQ